MLPLHSGLLSLRASRNGYTLVELLTATVLTLMMMAGVATVFGTIGDSIANSRANLEMTQALKAASDTLSDDLKVVTVTMSPPRAPEAGEGYFEYLEGPLGVVQFDPDNPRTINDSLLTANSGANEPYFPAVPVDADGNFDTSVGDNDDILLFTARNGSHPFVGRYFATGTIESEVAEVAWFVRGRTLYRRVLLVLPNATLPASQGFFRNNDLSVRNENGTLIANSLGDLTKRENRYGHQGTYPFDIRNWGQLRLPTLEECSYYDSATPVNSWIAGLTGPFTVPRPYARSSPVDALDTWSNLHPWNSLFSADSTYWTDSDNDGTTDVNMMAGRMDAYPGARVAEDIVLTNVIGFDVKAWDPGAPVFSDTTTGASLILVPGDPGYFATLNAATGATPANLVSYGAYVDLNYSKGLTSATKTFLGQSYFAGAGLSMHTSSGMQPRELNEGLGWTYDTWSTHYDNDGWYDADGNGSVNGGPVEGDHDYDGVVDEGTNSLDDPVDPTGKHFLVEDPPNSIVRNGVVDEPAERETVPPYPYALRGIQVKIRVFEPGTRQIREVTVVQDFLPK